MNYIFVDESGSMTTEHASKRCFFVCAMVYVKNKKKLIQVFKRFISKKLEDLNNIDYDNKMFVSGKFFELKSNCLTPVLKQEMARYLCQNNLFEVYYYRIDNRRLKDGNMYKNTARAFNFMTTCALKYYIHQKQIPREDFTLHIDQRNTKPDAINSFEDYINIELTIKEKLVNEIKVQYFESNNNILIQVADFFSNLYFSFCHHPRRYKTLFDDLENTGYIHRDFVFPMEEKTK